ncbi:MAG TPA: AarF/ABC1/UbiB kinase family protein, partial [Candidatus Sulfotelmatobacter sp.]|nr:AarF/ABC1/UbiB kinase family protein [Candidatus Sulfotelmatobacter sp.]
PPAMVMNADRTLHQGSRGKRLRARYREIAAVLWDERLLELLRGSGLQEHLPESEPADKAPSARREGQPVEVRLRHALERLGPVFTKIGQHLATRGDLLPPALLRELARLQDDVPAEPWPQMKACIEAELGAPLKKLYGSFTHTPLAAASLGQVHRATLLDGTTVAVKIQRPGITEAVEIDLEVAHDLASRLARRVPWAREGDLVVIVEDFAAALRAELDYAREGRSLDRFRTALADDPSLVIPRVYWDRTTSRVLTMDFIEGVPGTQLENTEKAAGIDRAGLVRSGVGAYFRMIFELGLYHADPHPGNLIALPGGRLGLVDFGRVATVSERNREAAFDMVMALLDDDTAAATEAVLAMTGAPPLLDLSAFELDIGSLLAQYRRQQSGTRSLETLLQGLLRLMKVHRLQVPSDLAALMGTLGVLEGVAVQLDPTFDMVEVIKPFARKLMPERYGPERILNASLRSARAYGRLFSALPVQAARALRRVAEGEFRLAVRPSDYEALVDRLTSGVYLLAYALIVGALIVGFAFLVSRQDLSRPERIGYRVVLFAAVASVIWLLGRSVRNEWRRRQSDRRRQGSV